MRAAGAHADDARAHTERVPGDKQKVRPFVHTPKAATIFCQVKCYYVGDWYRLWSTLLVIKRDFAIVMQMYLIGRASRPYVRSVCTVSLMRITAQHILTTLRPLLQSNQIKPTYMSIYLNTSFVPK